MKYFKSAFIILVVVMLSAILFAREPADLVMKKGEPDKILEFGINHFKYEYITYLDAANALSFEEYYFYNGQQYRYVNILMTDDKFSLQIAYETAIRQFSDSYSSLGEILINSYDKSTPKGQLWGLYIMDIENGLATLTISGYDVGVIIDFVIHDLAPETE